MRLNKRKRCGSGESNSLTGASTASSTTTTIMNTAYNGTTSSVNIKSVSPNENDPFNQIGVQTTIEKNNATVKSNPNVIINYFSNIHQNSKSQGESTVAGKMSSSSSSSSLMMPPPSIIPPQVQQQLSRSNSGYLTTSNSMQSPHANVYSAFMPPPPPPPTTAQQSQLSSTSQQQQQWASNFSNPYQQQTYFHPYDLARVMQQQQQQQSSQQQQQQQMRLNDISNSSSSSSKLAAVAAAAAAVPMAAAAAAAAAFVTSESFNNMLAARQKQPTNVLPINPYQMYGGATNCVPTSSTTFLPTTFDPLNTSNLAAKCSSYYCLTPAASTTSLNELNHSLSMNLHLNNSNNDSMLANNMNKKPKTTSSSTSSLTSSTSSLASLNHSQIVPNTVLITPTPSTTRVTTTTTKSRGSQSRTSVVSSSSSSSSSSIVTPTPVAPIKTEGSVEPVKRKRGRPRKSIAVVTAAPSIEAAVSVTKPVATVNLQRNKSTVVVTPTPPSSVYYEVAPKPKENHHGSGEELKTSPLPQLNWANSSEMWNAMKRKESVQYKHDWRYIDRHVEIEPKMRAILFDWLIEISHAYRLHRETFHLAVEYFDRFMTMSKQVVRIDRLQLIGITSLFIASKVEEIYPPKLKELASHMDTSYIKDIEQTISNFEIFMLKTLEWRISPITANTWLLAYLQIASTTTSSMITNPTVHNPHYVMPLNLQQIYQWCSASCSSPSPNNGPFKREQFFLSTYLRSVTLLDLCLLDIESLKYKYSELAAAAVYLMMSPPPGESNHSSSNVMLRVRYVETWTGLKWHEIEPCVTWMLPYADVCRDFVTDQKMLAVRQYSSVEPDDAHNIQIYHKYFDLWKEVQPRKTPQKTSVFQIQEILTPVSNQKCGP